MDNPRDLTTGSVSKKLLLYAIPIIISNLLQAIYSIVDMVIIGQFVGPTGMAAVSMGAQITTVVLNVMNGLYNSSMAMSAQLSGQGRRKEVSALLGTMLSVSAVVSIVLSVVIALLSSPILTLIHCPEAAFHEAVVYLCVCMIGTFFICAYNAMSAILRGVGNSRVPMIFVMITVCLNVVLDILFTAVFGWGVMGVALATIICQCISAALAFWYIKFKTDLFDFKAPSFKINKEYLGRVVKVGLPQCVQFFFASTSYVFLSSLINLYDVIPAAAAGAAGRIQAFAFLPAQGMMSALITHTAQNLGKNDPKRVTKGLRTAVLFAGGIGLIFTLIALLFPGAVFRIFTSNPEVIVAGIPFLRRMSIVFVLESMMFCTFGVITGSGYTPVTMCCGILSAFVCRYTAAWIFSQALGFGFLGIAMGYPFGPIVSGTICVVFLLTGKWKKSRISVGPAKGGPAKE